MQLPPPGDPMTRPEEPVVVEDAGQWRDECPGRPEIREVPAGFRVVWVDTGSGSGYEALVPEKD